jgi:outer membrane protein assembly factor BamB
MARGSRGAWLACALSLAACGGHAATASIGTRANPPAARTGRAHVATGDWPTFDYNAQRTGVGPRRTGITVANLARLRLRSVRIDGIVDSSPIELHAVQVRGRRRDLVAVTTSYGRTVAVDPGSGARLWEFVPPGVNSAAGNPQVTTASPVADPDRRYLYAASPNGVVHKLSIATGRQVWARSITFDPVHEKIASALNISGPYVVAVTGGYYGDTPPYDGHVVLIARTNGRIARVFNSECSNRHALIRASSCPGTNTNGDDAIWSRAGAVIEPGSSRILVATGNGPFNGSTNWGDSVLELSADAGRLLHNWTPTDQLALDHSDGDVGSTAPALLPTYHGLHLAIQGGKDSRLHLLDLGRLDGTAGPAGPRLGGELAQTSSPGGGEVMTTPAVWSQGGRVLVFVGDDSGTGAYRLIGGRHPRLGQVWEVGTPATSPVLAGGLLYVYDELAGRLLVRRPDNGAVLRSLPVAAGHWNSPIVVGGRIILPTGNYHNAAGSSTLEIYHLPGR